MLQLFFLQITAHCAMSDLLLWTVYWITSWADFKMSLIYMHVAQSCLTLCNSMDYIVHGILQARILDWVAIPSLGDLPNQGIKPRSLTLQADSLPVEPPGMPIYMHIYTHKYMHVYTQIYVYVYICVYMYVCVCVCIPKYKQSDMQCQL